MTRPTHSEAAEIIRKAFDGSGSSYNPRRAFHVQWVGLLETGYGTWAAVPGNWGGTTCRGVPPCGEHCIHVGKACWETFATREEGARSVVKWLLGHDATRAAIDAGGTVQEVAAAMKHHGYYEADPREYTARGLAGAREIWRAVPQYQGAVPEPEAGFIPDPMANWDTAQDLQRRIVRADSVVQNHPAVDGWPYGEWDDYFKRWAEFYDRLAESWWERTLAADRLKEYGAEFDAWTPLLEQLGVKQQVPRPDPPEADDEDGWQMISDSVVSVGALVVVGGIIYFMSKK